MALKALLTVDKEGSSIVLDSETTLSGFPREAWTYTLEYSPALERILDQYKEKKPKEPTIVNVRTISKVNSIKLATW